MGLFKDPQILKAFKKIQFISIRNFPVENTTKNMKGSALERRTGSALQLQYKIIFEM